MAVIKDLPLVRLTHQSMFPRRRCRSAGTSLIGVPQSVGSGIKIWECDLGIAPDFEQKRIKAFEAFIAGLLCSDIVRIPIYDLYGYGPDFSPAMAPFSDGTFFSDGTGFALAYVAPLEVVTDAVAGATQIFVKVTEPSIPNLRIGDAFSVDGFFYVVTQSTSAGSVRFGPPLRRAVNSGTVLQTDPPYFYGKPSGETFGQRGRGPNSIAPSITLPFIEAFDR